ncbi:glycerophosphoryl diester phosphodiesterase membrane domain-containing protein [Limosilactobacillus fastidiosus]|uniref:Glycerophosphodiester phosphodiesterase n=1 Tax=Limosilactobacillus fastidiosus TaxID=2759855 RepID=A0A7W3TYH6_9LACO|nr:glycerophosphodiester phosphodiesterase [Limosilactobacillus fastidiosus]MBB1085587.1 glycerophosphodiester phosphodiesterase [Limosilactobacillus fastidiosus]MCD7086040.1 glycerophosphodiester phosphodiesterase [Limosilactobacillus fastidiosus]MCD7114316.1 glycerophosphodiester phosphodiesterase [Limosilactobacillus fastidiosus]MCD7116323.1 glycerophosphodiester phosphodiesterase [Limosilactobacillus fastidiosus]
MRAIWRNLCQYSRNFWQHWVSFIILFVGMDLANQLIFIPLFRLTTTYVLQAGGIPFISYQNIGILITQHTLVVIGLLIELILLLLVIYWQFAFLLLGLRLILGGQISFKRLLKESWLAIQNIRPGSFPLLLLYFMLVLPFVDLVFRTPLLSKVQIPEFILDFMTRNSVLLTILIIFYIIITILGIRLILTLPLMIYRQYRTRQALRESWKLTSKLKWWQYIKQLIVLGLITVIILALFYLLIYGLQSLVDLFPGKLAFMAAIFNLTLVQVVSELLTIWTGMIALQIVIGLVDDFPASKGRLRRVGWLGWSTLGVMVVVLGGLAIANNYYYLKGTGMTRPVTISHRGVAEKNGVQNTIPAMEKTHRLKPTYVEMDVHETKDHKFVVLHDENLKKLTGVDKTPHELTLTQLTKLTARENGHQAKIASLDQYLNAAEKLHQKLLIEVKTTPQDSKGMLKRFNQQYGKRIIKDHDLVHSLDYRAVAGLKQLNPKLKVLYIQPYNFSYPKSIADGYSMEYSTLNFEFIRQAQRQKNDVYSWTVNDPRVMKQMMYDHVNGIITDNLGGLNSAIADFMNSKSYANRILNFILVVPNAGGLEP